MTLNINEIRKDFPIFQRETKPGVPLVYLDSTATSQKPLAVIEAMDQFYRRSNANIHRVVQALDADFLAFSAHKMCGPTGIGALYGKMDLLEKMPPFLGGGDMIKEVHLHSFRPNTLPYEFEAGTPAIAESVGFGAAVDYLSSLGMDAIAAHEHEITEYALERLEEVPSVQVIVPNRCMRNLVFLPNPVPAFIFTTARMKWICS